jgi:hypothetical protein
VTVFAWSALVVFTLTTGALLALLGRALFHALDRVDRVREEVFSMAKTVEAIALRLQNMESRLAEADQRAETQRDELRATMRRDIREALDGSSGTRVPR